MEGEELNAKSYMEGLRDGAKIGYEKCKEELADLRNELCEKCGKYKEAHKGACAGCRWEKWE